MPHPDCHVTQSFQEKSVRGGRHSKRKVSAEATGARAAGAVASGAYSIGLLAIGAAAIGALAIGRLAIGKARIRTLEIDNLSVGKMKLPDLSRASGDPWRRATIARVWRGRTRPELADAYEEYNYEVGIRRLEEYALGVETLREDRETETEFMTISYWEDVDAMSRFTDGAPNEIHHLPRDAEFLIELPSRVEVFRIRRSHGVTGHVR